MTITRSNSTSATMAMPGDFVRIQRPSGASFPDAPALSRAATMLGEGLCGTISIDKDEHYLTPDERAPELLRNLGKMRLSEYTEIQRVTVDHEHEKAILALEHIQVISKVARGQALSPDGGINRGAMMALLGPAATTDLAPIVAELEAAGYKLVEMTDTSSTVHRAIVITSDVDAARDGDITDAEQFDCGTRESRSRTVDEFGMARAKELLLGQHALSAVDPATIVMQAPEVAPATDVAADNAGDVASAERDLIGGQSIAALQAIAAGIEQNRTPIERSWTRSHVQNTTILTAQPDQVRAGVMPADAVVFSAAVVQRPAQALAPYNEERKQALLAAARERHAALVADTERANAAIAGELETAGPEEVAASAATAAIANIMYGQPPAAPAAPVAPIDMTAEGQLMADDVGLNPDILDEDDEEPEAPAPGA